MKVTYDVLNYCDTIDYSLNQFVSVLCVYSVSGECKPLYFNYQESDGESHRVKIDRIECCKPNSIFGLIYTCVVTINDIQSKVLLYYIKNTNQWSLRKL